MPLTINPTGYASDDNYIGEETHDLPSDTGELHYIKPVVTSNKHTQDSVQSYIDYRYILTFGFILLVLTLIYMYFETYASEIPVSDEANMTIEYAIDKTKKMREAEIVVESI
jgi:hypothetical protein